MARLPAFYPLLQGLTGDNADAVEHLTRRLRAAGLLPPSPRGHGAVHVDARSAANLLLAVMAGGTTSEAARAVQVLSGLRPLRTGGFGNACIGVLGRAAEAPTLIDALALLIEGAPTLKLLATDLLMLAYQTKDPALLSEDNVSLLFSIEFSIQLRPAPYASLVLRSPNERGMEVTEFRQEWRVDAALLAEGFYAPEMRNRSDLQVRSTITHRTLFRLGDLAADDTEEQSNETARTKGTPQPQGRGDAGDARQGGSGRPRSFRFGESGLRLPQD